MLDVFFTVDVEIWCGGWQDLDAKFPAAFEKHIYGSTPQGEVGLRHQCKVLKDHGLTAMFFVEPLFSGRFGLEPLTEIVGVVLEAGQEAQLHIHTEWVDEWPEHPLRGVTGKRQFMRDCSLAEQHILIEEGLRRIELANAPRPTCFRAGSFGFNADTLDAIRLAGLNVECSYNATTFGPSSGVAPGLLLCDTHEERDCFVLPMTVYDTGFGRLRHAQLGACSFAELEHLLWEALEQGRRSFVLLSHNFELLASSRRNADPIVLSRFHRLCQFFDRHRDCFRVRGWNGHPPPATGPQPPPLRSSAWRSAWRIGEQIYRRRHA